VYRLRVPANGLAQSLAAPDCRQNGIAGILPLTEGKAQATHIEHSFCVMLVCGALPARFNINDIPYGEFSWYGSHCGKLHMTLRPSCWSYRQVFVRR